jgi:hypothetical protein
MDPLNVSVIVAAKNEYTEQLKRHLTPLIQEGFTSIYEDAVLNDEEGYPLRQFQIFLKQIPKWNQTILDQETKRIKEKCPFLMDLVTAIFVSHVKILASVRIGGNHNNIKIKIPTAEIFVHSIYVNAAEQLYYDPYPFDELLQRKNVETIRETIENVVEDTIGAMIPIKSILEEYICDTFSDHTTPLPEPEPEPLPPVHKEYNAIDLVDNEEPMDNSMPFDNFSPETKTVNFEGDDPLMSIGDTTPFDDKMNNEVSALPSFDMTELEPSSNVEEDASIGNVLGSVNTEKESSILDDIFGTPKENNVGIDDGLPSFLNDISNNDNSNSNNNVLNDNSNNNVFNDNSNDNPLNPLDSLNSVSLDLEEKPIEKDFNFFDTNDNF